MAGRMAGAGVMIEATNPKVNFVVQVFGSSFFFVVRAN